MMMRGVIEILIVTFLTRFPALCPKEFWKVLSKHFNQRDSNRGARRRYTPYADKVSSDESKAGLFRQLCL